jgi:monovalent cation:proton antiporter-2 (CPA2) family protein
MAGPADNAFLIEAATYLGATAVAVPIFKRLKLGTILGFLAAGIALGPSALGVLEAEEGVFAIAELGVVLFLFVVGLELSLKRLWSLRRTIFGLGLLQMLVTGLAVTGILYGAGILSIGPAAIAGFALACSSTAFVLSFLQERGELNSPHGTKAFSVLLFQDLAVIPLLAAVPFVAMASQGGAGEAFEMDWRAIGLAAGSVAAVIAIGAFLLDPFFRLVARSGSREAFAAAALFTVAAVSLLVAEAGLSMALGAFLAGAMLAESSFRHQIESDIEPFRELLLGLFFIGVGMQLDLGVVAEAWWVILLAAAALMTLKAAIILVLAKAFGARDGNPLRIAAVLCQGGEFGFVVFSLGVGEGLFDTAFATLSSAVITLSMMATPLLVMAANRWAARSGQSPEISPLEHAKGQALIVGFGRFGQIVEQVLLGSEVEITAVDNDPKRIATAKSFGHEVFYGNGTDVHLLVKAGALNADVIVFAIRDTEGVKRAIGAIRQHCPKVHILVRAYDRMAAIELMEADADVIIRDTLESALKTAGHALGFLGRSPAIIEESIEEFRARDEERLLAQKAEGIMAKRDTMHRPFRAVREPKPKEEA